MPEPTDDRTGPDEPDARRAATGPGDPAEPDRAGDPTDRSEDKVLSPGNHNYQPPQTRRRGRGATRTRPPGPPEPLPEYEHLTIPEIIRRIPTLSADQVREVREYERAHRRRKTLLVRIERHLRDTDGETG
jgi:hypothetical protein